MKKIHFFNILLLFSSHILHAQTIPTWRTVNWHTSGNFYDFSNITDSVSVTDFGAVADGITDDFDAISNAIASFNGQAGMVYLPSGIYLIGSPLTLPDSIILKGSGAASTHLKFNTGENQNGIDISGSVAGDFFSLTDGYFKNSFTLTLADSGIFAAGDMAEIIQDANQYMTSSWAMNCLGQMLKIDSVNGFELYLNTALRMDYQQILNPRIRKVNPKKAISIQCLKIESLNPTIGQTSNIFFNNAINCDIVGVESHNCNFAHIEINKSTNISVRNSYLHHGHAYGGGGQAYGVCMQATTGECLIENNIFYNLRHSVLLQSGANGNVISGNYSCDPYWTGVSLPSNSAGDMVLHGNYPYANLFEGNICQHIVIDDSHGKNGPYNTFFRNRAELYGIFMNNAPATDSTNFVGNEVTNTGFLLGLYMLQGNGNFQHGNNIKGAMTPSGTGTLPDISYYYSGTPEYWNLLTNYPVIGPPAPFNTYINPAKTRYLSGTNLTPCFNDMISSNIEISKAFNKNKYKIISCFANQNGIYLKADFHTDSEIIINLFLTTGITLKSLTIKPQVGFNDIYIPYQSSKNSFIIISLIQNNTAWQKILSVF